MNIKKFVAFLTFCLVQVGWCSPLIESQQKELKHVSSVWKKQQIPNGMLGSSSLGDARSSTTKGVSLYAQNVDFYFVDGIGFHIDALAASFEPLNPSDPVNLDDPTQFMIRVHSGTILVPPHALSALFNRHILDYWPRPLNNLQIYTENQALIAQGGLRLWSWLPPIGWVPAYLKGGVVLNSQNQMVYTPYDVRGLGIPIAGLLQTLGIRLSSLLTLNRQGAHLIGNSIILDHHCLFPPPALAGQITRLCLDPAGLHLTFGSASMAQFSPPNTAGGSFIWIQSGDIKLYTTVVTNANILIKEHDNQNLVFNLYNYRNQIGSHNRVTMAEDGSIVLTMFNR